MEAGVDEAGRGPLAGPVVACAVILAANARISGLNDSKLLSEKKRNELAKIIREQAICVSIGIASVEEIDEMNIHHATLVAMKKAIVTLSMKPRKVWVDGLYIPPNIDVETMPVVKGDQKIESIMAASIIAKTTRDSMMLEYDKLYPSYGFAQHKGYGTSSHIDALKQFGITPIHRKSFQPVKSMYYGS